MKTPFNMLPQKISKFPFYIKLACVLFSLFAIGYLVIIAKEILSPLIFSCLFSILLLPVAVFFEKHVRLPRSVASLVAVIISLLAIGTLVYIIGTQIAGLTQDWPQFRQQIGKSMWQFRGWIQETFHITRIKQLQEVKSAASKVMAPDTATVGATVLSLSSIIMFLVFTFVYTFFFLLYRRLIRKFLEAVFPPEYKMTVYEITVQVQTIIRKYITGLLIEMSIVATGVSVVFTIIGLQYSLLLGLLTALLNIIPYAGILTALILSTIITLGTCTDSSLAIWVISTFVVTHLIDSNILIPAIVGSKVRINALVTLLGIVAGELIWGIRGMFLSVPCIAILKIIFDRVEGMQAWGLILGEDEKRKIFLSQL